MLPEFTNEWDMIEPSGRAIENFGSGEAAAGRRTIYAVSTSSSQGAANYPSGGKINYATVATKTNTGRNRGSGNRGYSSTSGQQVDYNSGVFKHRALCFR